MSVPTDTVSAEYSLNVYHESSPYVEFTATVSASLNWTSPDPDTLDGYLRAGMQAIVDAAKSDYPAATVQGVVTYDRHTLGTPVTPS